MKMGGSVAGRTAAAVVMMALLLWVSEGSKETETRSSSSQERIKSNVNVLISESVTSTRASHSPENLILPTELPLENSSYPERTEILTTQDSPTRKERLQTRGTSDDRNYYDAIRPTESGAGGEELRISQTEILEEGNGTGVSMGSSGPQKTRRMSYRRTRRGFGNEESSEKPEDGRKTEKKRSNSGKSYNEIEQTLRKIAKVAVSDENPPTGSTVVPINFRESREEENRKASPDIQDIITGIVNILNGKNTKQSDGARPRPTGTRINNRGPPRISDVPPLDFDSPPAYRPLPPPPPKRVPPPYPFDMPPTVQNIPLPPQPVKPPSKLPPHPFIDGVPIPKIVIPEEQTKRPDAEPTRPVANATKIPVTTEKPKNSTTIKQKIAGTKTTPGSGSKNQNKRVRPTPVSTTSEKPVETTTQQEKKNTTASNSTTESIKTTTEYKTTTEEKTTTAKTTELAKNVTESPTVATTPPATINYTEEESKLAVLLEPSVGIGEATPVLETSILEISMLPTEQTQTSTPAMSRPASDSSQVYKARPGIVLDDPEYKPGGHKRPVVSPRPIITAPPSHSHYGEIFDVTVHAVQGPENSASGKPVIVPVNLDQIHKSQVNQGDVSVITKPEEGQNFVSIDGKRTYINLFGEASPTTISPTPTQPHITGTGYAIPHKDAPVIQPNANRPASPPRRPYKRPSHPPVRIDTCIVGDDITCDSAQNEMCRTEDGVSSCHCRPGYNRRNHRDTCRRVVSMMTSLRVDRLYDRRVKWQDNLRDPDSDEYRQLSYEASQAIESAMSMTPFSDDFINSRINSIYTAKNLENNEPAVYVNVTLQLEENLDTVRPAVKHDIQRHLLRVIQRRNNNVGNSAVWVDAPPGSVLALQDVDECTSSELHDCHERAICLNTFGSFKCQCPTGSRDPWIGNIHREGRFCETCSPEFCNNRGECSFEHGQQVCHCSGSFYGSQCEIDGEVLGVAIGASVAAAIIIVLTLICLCMWSRRWSREQKTAVGSPVFGYMATGPAVKTPSVGSPPYQVSLEDRIRWAQIADVMAKSNHYAQPEPVNATTRTSFGGYPTLPSHTMSMPTTLPLPTITPPVPLPRLTLANKQPMSTYGGHSQFGSLHQSNHGMRSSLETSSSEEDADRVDLLGRNFNAPRPKSRTSVANQSGIYYDVDFDRSDAYSKQNTIPLNTYTLNPQHQVRPYFR